MALLNQFSLPSQYLHDENSECSGITPEILQAVDWNRVDLSEWLALLKLQNKLPELNADTLKSLNLETLLSPLEELLKSAVSAYPDSMIQNLTMTRSRPRAAGKPTIAIRPREQ